MDEKLLQDIGRIAREEDAAERRFDEPWRRLTAGDLGQDEEEALRADAAQSPTTRDDHEAFRPLGEDFQARMLSEWQKRTRDGADNERAGTAEAEARVIPFERPAGSSHWRSARPWLALAATLTLAVLGFWLLRGPGAPGEPLPVYDYELEGGQSATRSGDVETEDVSTFLPGSTFRLVLTPPEPLDERPRFDFYLAAEDGTFERWNVGHGISREGVVKIEGILGEDFDVAPGRYVLAVVYGLPGRLPEPRRLEDLASPEDRVWNVLRIPFRVETNEAALDELPLDVEWTGCYAVLPGPTCVPYTELTFWARSDPGARIEVRVGGRLVEDAGVAIDGGHRWKFEVSSNDGEVEVLATTAGRKSRRFGLALAANQEPDWYREAGRLAYYDEAEAARQKLEEHLPNADSTTRGLVLSWLATLESVPRRAWLEEAAALHRQSDRLLALAYDVGTLSFLDLGARRFAQLRQRLDDLEALLPRDAPAKARFVLGYYRGILARDLGDHRTARLRLEGAYDLARRVNLRSDLAAAESALALLLTNLGRGDEALARFREIDLAAMAACERARTLNNHAWASVRAGAGAPHRDFAAEDPLPLLAAAAKLVRERECGVEIELNVLLNRALAEAARRRSFEAHEALARAEPLLAEASALHLLWWRELEGRLALADGRGHDSLEHYRRMDALAESAFDPAGVWQAKIGQARAHHASGDAAAALAAFRAAEDLTEEQSLRVPLDAGRESFVEDRETGVRQHLELLLAEGREEEALAAARRSRARVLRMLYRAHRLARLDVEEQARWDLEMARYLDLRATLEERAADDWRLSGSRRRAAEEGRDALRDEARQSLDRAFQILGDPGPPPALPPLAEGELTLVHHPLVEDWVAFAAAPGRLRLHRFTFDQDLLGQPAALAERLLEPFREEIVAADRVRVSTYGPLREVDFHALPFAGDALAAHRPVVYGLDLGPPAARAAAAGSALVVADPRGDLPAARHEGAAAEEALHAAAFEVHRLEGPRATAAALRRAASDVGLLHFAGHGTAAGRFGFESALFLAGGTTLVPGDVLALERVPARVVLSSCESAREAGTATASLGIAQSFLVAGAERVIAASRPVGDSATAELFRLLYSSWDGREDLSIAFRRAQLTWRTDDPAADWSSFRVLEP